MINLMLGNCLDNMRSIKEGYVDLTVTSPPYDDLRDYEKVSTWNMSMWKSIIQDLYRVTKVGGCVVWIVGDATIGGSETGTSFRQALFFMEVGFNLHDTMIWNKGGFSAVGALKVRYAPVFEYMFVFTKGKLNTFNPIKDKKNINGGKVASGTIRQRDGSTKPMSKTMIINEYGQRYNIWDISPQRQRGGHPAPFPEQIASDHIISWSNPGDIVLDPLMGSGTTGKCAVDLGRNFIGIEINEKYFNQAKSRIYGGDK